MEIIPVSLPPQIVSLPDAKLHLKVDFSADDVLINDCAKMAQAYIQAETGKLIGEQVLDLLFDRFHPISDRQVNVRLDSVVGVNAMAWGPRFSYVNEDDDPRSIPLDLAPLSAVQSVKYLDKTEVEQTLDPAQYVVTRGRRVKVVLRSAYSWPTLADIPQAVRIRVKGGFKVGANLSLGESELPADLYKALFILINHFYEYREMVYTGLNLSNFPVEAQVARICSHYAEVNI